MEVFTPRQHWMTPEANSQSQGLRLSREPGREPSSAHDQEANQEFDQTHLSGAHDHSRESPISESGLGSAMFSDDRPVGRGVGLSPWMWLGIGLVCAPIFGLTPLLRSIGWFFAAIAHELGHTATSWFLGAPAFPQISLSHGAATQSFAPNPLMQIAVGLSMGGLAYLALATRRGTLTAVLAGVGAVLAYVVVTQTGLAHLFMLLGGHATELTIGMVFLFRAITGFSTAHAADRALASTMGMYLVGSNLFLTGGLALSKTAQLEYRGNQSFGIENDYARVASEYGMSLGAVGFGMSLAAMICLCVACVFTHTWSMDRQR